MPSAIKSCISIFWPNVDPPEITELEYSYHFCHEVSKDLCVQNIPSCQWVNYSLDQPASDLIGNLNCEYAVFVTEPEILLNPWALNQMQQTLQDGHQICGPVFNETDFFQQQAELPAPYVNLSTYFEIASQLAGFCSYSQVPELDPGCFMLKISSLKKRKKIKQSIQEFVKLFSKDCVVEKNALIHRFGQYYYSQRDDLIDIIPDCANNILDVGCAFGGYGKRLKAVRPEVMLTGVELNPVMAKFAENFYDQIFNKPVEDIFWENSFDLINCGDVLEHLQDPWLMLKRFNKLLNTGGYLVTSIPNVGHWSVVRDLLQGRFEYIPVGLVCITHIRWFTEVSLRKAFYDAGFEICKLDRLQLKATSQGEQFIAHMLEIGYGDEQSLRTNEFIVLAKKN